jgi:hypothetical protein
LACHKHYYVIDTGLNTNPSRLAFLSTEVIQYDICTIFQLFSEGLLLPVLDSKAGQQYQQGAQA